MPVGDNNMPPSDSKHPALTQAEFDIAMRFPTDVAMRDKLTIQAYAHAKRQGELTDVCFENAKAQWGELATDRELLNFPHMQTFIFWLVKLIKYYNK